MLSIKSMKPIYRKYSDSDISPIIKLMGQLGYKHSANSINHNIMAVKEAGGEVFVTELSGEVCGCVSAIIDIRLAAGINGEIVSLVVNKKFNKPTKKKSSVRRCLPKKVQF